MISERYFSRDKDLISLRSVDWPVALIPVRSLFMKAVFFLSDESSEAATAKMSTQVMVSDGTDSMSTCDRTFCAIPDLEVQVTQVSFDNVSTMLTAAG